MHSMQGNTLAWVVENIKMVLTRKTEQHIMDRVEGIRMVSIKEVLQHLKKAMLCTVILIHQRDTMARVLEEEDIMMVQENSSVIITQIQNSDYSMKGDSIMFMEDILMVLTMETIQPIKMSTIK